MTCEIRTEPTACRTSETVTLFLMLPSANGATLTGMVVRCAPDSPANLPLAALFSAGMESVPVIGDLTPGTPYYCQVALSALVLEALRLAPQTRAAVAASPPADVSAWSATVPFQTLYKPGAYCSTFRA
jgi:hypothetical protein